MMGALITTDGFVVPHNPLLTPNIPETGNPVLAGLAEGCTTGGCLGQINGMGSFEVFGASIPGSQWMWMMGLGLVAGIYLMRKKS